MIQQPSTAMLVALALLQVARAQDSGVGFITQCKPGYFGLTFDDGPSNNTGKLLDTLAAAQVKVTFFIQGNQLKPETSGFTKRAHDEGHQIGSHTWDHKSLNSLSEAQIKQEMLMNEDVIKNVTGIIPQYMRPPFGDCNARCASTLSSMGYHVVQWNIDSNDWRYETTPDQWFRVSEDVLKVEDVNTTVTNNPQMGYVSLQHDTLPFSVDQVPQIIEKIKALGLQIAPIAECMDNPPAPMYRGGSNQTTSTSTSTTSTSTPTSEPNVSDSDAAQPTANSPMGATSLATSFQNAAVSAVHMHALYATTFAIATVATVMVLAA